jgi:hypothetical protein
MPHNSGAAFLCFSLHFHNNFACQKQHVFAILRIGLEKNNIEGRYTGEK